MRVLGIEQEITGAIFDFDGTLMDSMPAWAGKMLHLLDSYSVSYPPDIIRTITPLGDAGATAYFQNELGLQLSDEAIAQQLDAYALPRYRDSILPKPGVTAVLRRLQENGVAACILTASPQKMIRPCLARNGLQDAFRFALTCDELGLTKTQPAIYHKTCAMLGSEPSATLFFDDNLLALRTAAAAGLPTIGVYDDSSADDEAAIRAITRRYLRSWSDL